MIKEININCQCQRKECKNNGICEECLKFHTADGSLPTCESIIIKKDKKDQ